MSTIRAVVVLADMVAWTNTRRAQEHTYENLQLHFKLCCFLKPDLSCPLRCKVTNYIPSLKKICISCMMNANDKKTCQMFWTHCGLK